MDITILGFPAIVVIVAIVEFIKLIGGVEGNKAIVASIIVGLILSIGIHVAELLPQFKEWWEVVLAGILLGLAASGLFDAGKAVLKRN